MRLIYSLADIVLSCSTDPEAFGRIPVEAQEFEKTIIASNHGGHMVKYHHPLHLKQIIYLVEIILDQVN